MRQHTTMILSLTSALLAALVLAGCGSSRPSKFYLLSATCAAEAATGQTVQRPAVTLGVGPVLIPDYLDRPQIVTSKGPNEVLVAEFDRWGGSMQQNVAGVLMENLSALLGADRVSVIPWDRSGPLAYRLSVEVVRFDATPGQEVRLRALWTISGPDGTVASVTTESNVTEPAAIRKYPDIVAAMSRALGTLSRQQAEGVRSFLDGAAKNGASVRQ